MSNDLMALPQGFGQSVVLAGDAAPENLGEGISGGYAILGYRGKVWSIRRSGEETPITVDFNGQTIPAPFIDTVIVKASGVISKVWYENGYQEGNSAPPDCLSTNGIVPVATSPKKQAPACSVCPRNQWGSGKEGKGKACADAKRLAVAPINDLRPESLMLLRVPPASLRALKQYGDSMTRRGFPLYYRYGTRFSFDAAESYPKFVFQPVRAMSHDEAVIIEELRNDPVTDQIIAEDGGAMADTGNGQVQWAQQQVQQPAPNPATAGAGQPAPAAQAAPKATKPKATKAAKAPQNVAPAAAPSIVPGAQPDQNAGASFDEDLDNLIEG